MSVPTNHMVRHIASKAIYVCVASAKFQKVEGTIKVTQEVLGREVLICCPLENKNEGDSITFDADIDYETRRLFFSEEVEPYLPNIYMLRSELNKKAVATAIILQTCESGGEDESAKYTIRRIKQVKRLLGLDLREAKAAVEAASDIVDKHRGTWWFQNVVTYLPMEQLEAILV